MHAPEGEASMDEDVSCEDCRIIMLSHFYPSDSRVTPALKGRKSTQFKSLATGDTMEPVNPKTS